MRRLPAAAVALLAAGCPPQPEPEPTPEPTPGFCDTEGLPAIAFDTTGTGFRRHDLAPDFSIDLLGESEWTLGERWTGCESYLFVPDEIPVSSLDNTSVWELPDAISELVARSPRYVHYFFVSTRGESGATEASEGLRAAIDTWLDEADAEDATYWRERLHVAYRRASRLDNWLTDAFAGHGSEGFGIDRRQRIRGVGSFADVARYSQALSNAGRWPWEANLGYAGYEAIRFDYEAARSQRWAGEGATVVPLFDGSVISQFAEVEVTLPDAAAMAGFDTLEIEVDQRCPNGDAVEFNNCGAWDYLAGLSVRNADDTAWIEVARFITTYHREAWLSVDATPFLALLGDGGTRRMRWEWAPEWNVQPTATFVNLRFSNQGKGYRPDTLTYLFTGGGFNSQYNVSRTPVDVPIGAGTARTELFALITGHGGDNLNCAEFCNHQHEFTVNGEVFLKDFPVVGQDDGCSTTVDSGTVPNQGGTWWFGRGGWCPGRQVDPYVVDVTDLAAESATVSYRGLLNGNTPPDNSGNIFLNAWLVTYR